MFMLLPSTIIISFNCKHWNGVNNLFLRNGNEAELKLLMEWKYGPAKQQTNQSSTKSKCLCFVVLIDGCVALVAAPAAPALPFASIK